MGLRPWLASARDFAAIALFTGMFGALFARLIALFGDRAPSWWIPAGLGVGFVASDFASGLAHWVADRFFRSDTPILGPFLIKGFREHHADPMAITRHGFLETNGANALVQLPVLAAALWLVPAAPVYTPLLEFALSTLVALALGVFMTNQFHKWAHAQSVPPVVAWLQSHRLILSAEHHALHHAGGHAGAYCVTTGWLNPLLDSAGFFPRLERWVHLLQAWLGLNPGSGAASAPGGSRRRA